MDNTQIEKTVYGIIYMILSKNNDKKYIGQTLSHQCLKNGTWKKTGINSRWTAHLREMRNGNEIQLYSDMREYGIENFAIFEIKKLYEIQDILKIESIEYEFINKFETLCPNGYNTFASSLPKKSNTKIQLASFYNIDINDIFLPDFEDSEYNSERNVSSKSIQKKFIKDDTFEYSQNDDKFTRVIHDKDDYQKIFSNKEDRTGSIASFINELLGEEYDLDILLNETKTNLVLKLKDANHKKIKGKKELVYSDIYNNKRNYDNRDEFIDFLKDKKITKIYSYKSFHRDRGIIATIVRVNFSGGYKKISFGGKGILPDKAQEKAQKFIERLYRHFNLENIKEEKLKVEEEKLYDFSEKIDKFENDDIIRKIGSVYYESANTICVNVFIQNDSVKTRKSITFGSKKSDIDITIDRANKFIDLLKIKFDIKDDIIERPSTDKGYIYQKDLDFFSDKKIDRIINKKQTKSGNEIYFIQIFYKENGCKNQKRKQISIGGGNVSIDDAEKKGLEFLEKLKKLYNI